MRSLPVGHILGIPVSIHPTVGILAAVLIVQQGVLVDRGREGFVLATLLVVLLFASVILHEIGHAVMARHFGLIVSDISLSPIGGVARIERLPHHSPVETLVALAGPLVNLAIAVALVPLLVVLAFVAGYSSVSELLTNAFTGTGPVALIVSFLLLNLLLLVFNLLPAFPMDGGRILRSLLAGRFGREQGTRIAVVTGQVLGVVIVAAAFIWHLWALIPVGAFVAIAAQTEWRDVQVDQALRRYRVGPYALWDSGGLEPTRPLSFALRGGPRDCVVTRNGRVIGMVWRHQLLQALQGGTGQRQVSDIMDTDIVTADVDDSLHDVEQWMHETNRWAIPVTEAGVYRGIFTADRFVHIRRRLAGNVWDPRDIGAALLGRVRQGLRGEVR